jgi:hypothetical protein
LADPSIGTIFSTYTPPKIYCMLYKGGKPEPQKGWRRHLVSEFALFKSTVTPEPQNAKPVFKPKDIHHKKPKEKHWSTKHYTEN